MIRFSMGALALVLALGVSGARAADEGKPHTFKVGDDEREALVFAPESAKSKPTAIVFAFHGRGGTMNDSPKRFAIEKNWPEAITVYPQGLKVARPGRNGGPGKKSFGWQHQPDDQDGRDLKFFDVMLEALKKEYSVDEKRIYVTGFSNGADFTYLLWATRGNVISAVAPCAGGGEKFLGRYSSIPAMIVSGVKDPHYKMANQKKTVEALKALNDCSETGQKWSDLCTYYPSKKGVPVASYFHPLGHTVPPEVPGMMVKFFKSLGQPEQ